MRDYRVYKNTWGPVLERNYWLCQCKNVNHVDPFAVASSSLITRDRGPCGFKGTVSGMQIAKQVINYNV